jgi:alpha-L-fucosidase
MWYYNSCQLDAKELQKQISHSKWPRYININSTYKQKRIFMHNILREYSNQQIFQYSKKHKNFKRTNEDTANTMEWEDMCKECQNIGRNMRKTHNMIW